MVKILDEKMKEALESIYEKMTDEQKEKAKACKTPDELMAFAGREGIELPDDLLENVAGGSWLHDAWIAIFGDPNE